LLLPEPLAVNRNERVVGSIKFKVNNSRSYDLTLSIGVDRDGASQGGGQDDPLWRVANYNLSQQTFK
jgi:histone-arginine methyltransferase CARM1